MKKEVQDNSVSQLELNSEYFKLIEDALDYNNSSSVGWAKKQLKLVLNAFLEGKSVVILDLGIKLKSISEYNEWKKDRNKLNIFNSESLIKEIEFSKFRNQKWLS